MRVGKGAVPNLKEEARLYSEKDRAWRKDRGGGILRQGEGAGPDPDREKREGLFRKKGGAWLGEERGIEVCLGERSGRVREGERDRLDPEKVKG